VHAKSTSELISFGFSDRSTLSPKFGLSETLSESLSPNEKTDFILWLIFHLSPKHPKHPKTNPKVT